MITYVTGFMFSLDRSKVALIRKTKPTWMKGMFNGIGGKIEPGEEPMDAMRREFLEESGCDYVGAWNPLLCLSGKDYSVQFFYCFSDNIYELRSVTEEIIQIIDVGMIGTIGVVGNLKWLIPMCLDDSLMSQDISRKADSPALGVYGHVTHEPTSGYHGTLTSGQDHRLHESSSGYNGYDKVDNVYRGDVEQKSFRKPSSFFQKENDILNMELGDVISLRKIGSGIDDYKVRVRRVPNGWTFEYYLYESAPNVVFVPYSL